MSLSIGSNPASALSGATMPAEGVRVRQDRAFDQLLEKAAAGAGEDEIRTSAEQLVSATFIVPMLASVRESSMAVEPFAPTPAEKQFGALLDQRVADEIVKSSNLPIVDRLVRDIGARSRMAPQPASPAPEPTIPQTTFEVSA